MSLDRRLYITLGGQVLYVGSAPNADILNQWQQGSTIIGQRIFDGRGNCPLRLSLYDAVTDELAELLGEHLLRNAGYQPPDRREVLR